MERRQPFKMDPQNVPTSLDSSSSEDLDDLCLDQELADIDLSVPSRKPHFLDYDAIPPPGFEDSSAIQKITISSTTSGVSGENVKVDKKYERDGEISDFELAASGITKKELRPQRSISNDNGKNTGARKKKHFLDENPIPPDYMVDKEREHRSLDRNFERQNDFNSLRNERKHSLDRENRHGKGKEPSYTLSRFIEGEITSGCHGTWPADVHPETTINYSSMPTENLSNLGPKVECVYSLLSMLGSHDSLEMSKKFLELSRTTETCATLRRCGCIPLLVQMMHSDGDESARKRAALALHNVVHCHPDDKAGRREAKVLRLIEQIMDYCNFLKTHLISGGEAIADDADRHPLAAISSLMKVSFDEEHRHAMCQLGSLQAIATLVHLDHAVHGPKPEDQCCNSLRRYALMALTNLTFGDGNNKALLCGNKEFMEALVAQLDSAPDDLLQVTASVLRNLSWRADNNMKAVLNEIGTVTALAKAAMKNKNENTLKAILSALWNLSAHCSTNKAEFCAVEGALAFLVDMLTYEGPSKTLKIIENAGGILRNVSSHIAVREDYRRILRQRNCLGILLQQLKSESLTVVSNACGTLWNLSARFPEDQKFLWDNGAVPMLRSLIHSKHKMISEGSSAALKNLLNFRPGSLNQNNLDPIAKSMGLKELPTLNARKQRALEQELNQNLAETCDNLDAVTPPKEKKDFVDSKEISKDPTATRLTRSAIVSKSESRDSIISAKSDSVFERYRRGHSAPPSHESVSKDPKLHGSFNRRNNYAVGNAFENEPETEQPIDYGAKYNNENSAAHKVEPSSATQSKPVRKNEAARNYSVYQETDLDQPTDFSLRYAENQAESDSDEKGTANSGNEIILILEDTVKCYQTEGTPYAISNAASVTDLRNPKLEEPPVPPKRVHNPKPDGNVYGSGTYTPEKPTFYYEEGTPGCFSRYESLSSLDESPQNCITNVAKAKPEVVEEEISPERKLEKLPMANKKTETPLKVEKRKSIPPSTSQSSGTIINKTITSANSAQETPLMFSRRSSMDSLASAEPITADDKSSVVSDFSRLASGVVSPSELPDSPTQSMPQSPRRNSNVNPPFPNIVPAPVHKSNGQQRLRSVFEDDLNTFHVENTPAQFSCSTSLSNLSIDDEPKITTDGLAKELLHNKSNEEKLISLEKKDEIKSEKNDESCALSEDEEEEETDDNIILATCINIGMNRVSSLSKLPHSSPLPQTTTDHHENGSQLKETNSNEDALKQYCTEDTPALLSKVGSNSNLSVLSNLTNKADALNLSDESSNASDCGNELLEQCIRDGMQKSSSSKPKTERNDPITTQKDITKDPIAMLRRGGLPPYLPVRDEMNKFLVEDSPCNFSVISGLSNLTIGSGIAGPANMKRSVSKEPDPKGFENDTISSERKQFAEDSLSSISIESEDDSNLLSQAIAAGCNKAKSKSDSANNVSIPSSSSSKKTTRHLHEPNESISSVDSSDSNDNQSKSLFEQCIRTGMNKLKKVDKIPKPILSPKRSQLPTLNFGMNIKTPLKIDREKQRERERKDEQLLRECINTGISKNVRFDSQIKPPVRHMRQVLAPTEFNQRVVPGAIGSVQHSIPKNGETTSVAVLEQQRQLEIITSQGAPSIVPDVGMRESPDGTSNESKNQTHLDHHLIENILNTIGSENLEISHDSLNLSTDGHPLLDQSNEYPALKLSSIDFNEDSVNESSFEMEISNEFLIDKDNNEQDSSLSQRILSDKHKDPDLMLKSVERLTQQLVSTAEYLRTNASNSSDSNEYDSNNTIYEKKSVSNSNSNNTWNEDTCPNDVSFPSVSVTAPMIASLNDDETTLSEVNVPKRNSQEFTEITPTNEINPIVKLEIESANGIANHVPQECFFRPDSGSSQLNSLETETDTLVNDETDGSSSGTDNKNSVSSGIQFRVGGEVQQPLSANVNHYTSSGPMSFEVSSAMTSSTIIAIEANNLAHQLMKSMTESTTSLDLDNIRPPSAMDCLSISGCYDIPHSPQLSRLRKKSLPVGIMARRAINGGPQNVMSGSVESVNSTCNLDNIKPPSLMDELLDSMISVASITSEVVDNSLETHTNYETAFSDVDENTTTLQSCMDTLLPSDYDDSNGTPIPSDFSSAESTPRKGRGNNHCNGVKRALTPKQKRRIIKDRYKTYTIAADFVLKENYEMQTANEYDEEDEIIKIEIEHVDLKDIDVGSSLEQEQCNLIVNGKNGQDENQSSIKRRSLDPDRYKTRTICFNGQQKSSTQMTSTSGVLFESQTSAEDDTEEMSSIRALTRKFKFINQPENPKNTNLISPKKQISVSSLLKTKLLEEEPRTIESDFNSIEYDQNSETESCDQNISRTDDESSSPKKIVKPKIIKPTGKSTSSDLNCNEECATPPIELNKAVRGRKKPAYVSPYRRSAALSTITNQRTTSPKSQIGNTIFRANLGSKIAANPDVKKTIASKNLGKGQAIVAKTHVILNKASLTNKVNGVKSGISRPGFLGNQTNGASKKKVILEKNLLNKKTNVETKTKEPIKTEIKQSETEVATPLERQGTFVKDEPINLDVPIVTSLPATPAKTSKLPMKKPSNIPKSPAKTGILNSKLRTPIQKSSSMETNSKLLTKQIPSSTTATNSARQKSGIASIELAKRKNLIGGVRKSPSVPTVPQRSNSNNSIRVVPTVSGLRNDLPSTTPPSRSNSNLTGSRSNIASRISGIWKRTEENKTKSSQISKSTSKLSAGSSSKIVRSSTFDNTPPLSENVAANKSGLKLNDKGSSSRISSSSSGSSGVGVSVVRRIKNSMLPENTTPTKRTSRIGTFINVEGDCQVAG